MRLWRGATKWVALWLLLSVLTLLHSFALIEALYDVPIAKVHPSPTLFLQTCSIKDARAVLMKRDRLHRCTEMLQFAQPENSAHLMRALR